MAGTSLKKLRTYFIKGWIHLLHKIPSIAFFNSFLRTSISNKGFIIALHRVLPIHQQGSAFNSFIEISVSKLEEVICNLKNLQVKFVTLQQLNASLNETTGGGSPIVHISFDDGYFDNYSLAFENLKKHNVCFSIFITSDFIDNRQPFLWWYLLEYIITNEIAVNFDKYNFAINEEDYKKNTKMNLFNSVRNFMLNNIEDDEDYFKEKLMNLIEPSAGMIVPKMLRWKEINEMIRSGLCEIGIHTKSHFRFANLTRLEKIRQIELCKNEIVKHTGNTPTYFAYPYGSKEDVGQTDDLEDIMRICGVELAFSTIPAELNHSSPRLMLPRLFINNSATMYTLKTRLNGSYQRGLVVHKNNADGTF